MTRSAVGVAHHPFVGTGVQVDAGYLVDGGNIGVERGDSLRLWLNSPI